MSDYCMYVFPADLRDPKPDRRKLRAQLIERGFIIERAKTIPRRALYELWIAVSGDRQASHRAPDPLNDAGDLLAGLRHAKIVPPDFTPDWHGLSVEDLIALMYDFGLVSPELARRYGETFVPGPLFHALSDRPYHDGITSISFDSNDDKITIFAGQNLAYPPRIPGTDRTVEDWSDFITRTWQDPNETWTDTTTGRRYHLLDLDWQHTLGAGKCALTIDDPGYLNGNMVCALLHEITGQLFQYSVCQF